MTVSYQYDVASSTSGGFTRLLFKWRGSLYKLIYKELSMFAIAYITVSLVYRFLFTEDQKRSFEKVALYCDTFMNYIPLSFILGFYVSFVASRWWQQYIAIPWPDKLDHAIALYIVGSDEQGRILRRSLVRYLNLSLVLVLRSISSAVKKRFPTLDHLVDAGFITRKELDMFNLVPNTEFNTYWVPCTWFTALLKDAKAARGIVDPVGLKLIMEEFCEFRQKCGLLWSYDWVSIPLVYTQVVTIATYAFFIASLVGRQFVDKSPLPYKNGVDMFIPFFTLLQYFFYMGLLKVAEQLINPFGDDDEDFELNWIIDRHMKVSYLIVDTLLLRTPIMTKDMFFDDESIQLPYTEASALFKKRTYRGSVADMIIPEKEQNMILPDIQEESEIIDDKHAFRESTISALLRDGRFYDDFEIGTPSPHTPRRDSGISNTTVSGGPMKMMSRGKRTATTGSKGIGGALLSVGHHQGFLATYPEKLTDSAVESEEKFVDEDYGLDSASISYEDETARKNKGKLAQSLKAKVAVKKKPVLKWRPYKRPERLDELPFPAIGDATPPRGMFEEECAFMWRTIDMDDTESLQTPVSGASSDPHGDFDQTDGQVFSHYNEIRPAIVSNDPQFEIPKFRGKHKRNRFSWHRPSILSSKLTTSWPLIYRPKCSHKKLPPDLLKSISETSVFLDTLASRLRLLHNQQKRHSNNSRKSPLIKKRESNTRSSAPNLCSSNIS